jgi:5-deoxy-D-glucuronate isomerase
MTLPIRIGAAAVTVVTAVSVSTAIFGTPAQHGQKNESEMQSSAYVDHQRRETENERVLRNILQDSRNSDELSSVEDRRAADDVIRSILERP